MVYVPKCSDSYSQRIDCGLCAKRCPEGTIKDALGTACRKPAIKKRRIYNNKSACFKKEENTDLCEEFEGYVTTKCPAGFSSLGDFMCEFKCPEGFSDNRLYCI